MIWLNNIIFLLVIHIFFSCLDLLRSNCSRGSTVVAVKVSKDFHDIELKTWRGETFVLEPAEIWRLDQQVLGQREVTSLWLGVSKGFSICSEELRLSWDRWLLWPQARSSILVIAVKGALQIVSDLRNRNGPALSVPILEDILRYFRLHWWLVPSVCHPGSHGYSRTTFGGFPDPFVNFIFYKKN